MPTSSVKTFGTLSYSTTTNLGDTVNVEVNGLAQPASGKHYEIWLENTSDETYLNIGSLTLDGLGNGIHQYVDDSDQGMLPGFYNAVLVSEEDETGDTPGGDIVYSGVTPESVRAALYEIFMASDLGFSGGSLYGGAIAEAELSVTHTSWDHGNHDRFGLVNRTEHTINILMNTEIDYDGSGLAENPGFHVGVPAMLDAIEDRLNFDFSSSDLRPTLQSDVVRVDACIRNVRDRLSQLYDLETGWTRTAGRGHAGVCRGTDPRTRRTWFTG